jgi:hypothetical protein
VLLPCCPQKAPDKPQSLLVRVGQHPNDLLDSFFPLDGCRIAFHVPLSFPSDHPQQEEIHTPQRPYVHVPQHPHDLLDLRFSIVIHALVPFFRETERITASRFASFVFFLYRSEDYLISRCWVVYLPYPARFVRLCLVYSAAFLSFCSREPRHLLFRPFGLFPKGILPETERPQRAVALAGAKLYLLHAAAAAVKAFLTDDFYRVCAFGHRKTSFKLSLTFERGHSNIFTPSLQKVGNGFPVLSVAKLSSAGNFLFFSFQTVVHRLDTLPDDVGLALPGFLRAVLQAVYILL